MPGSGADQLVDSSKRSMLLFQTLCFGVKGAEVMLLSSCEACTLDIGLKSFVLCGHGDVTMNPR